MHHHPPITNYPSYKNKKLHQRHSPPTLEHNVTNHKHRIASEDDTRLSIKHEGSFLLSDADFSRSDIIEDIITQPHYLLRLTRPLQT